jgi:hypothetical protein
MKMGMTEPQHPILADSSYIESEQTLNNTFHERPVRQAFHKK